MYSFLTAMWIDIYIGTGNDVEYASGVESVIFNKYNYQRTTL
jgi:hypothetical protein